MTIERIFIAEKLSHITKSRYKRIFSLIFEPLMLCMSEYPRPLWVSMGSYKSGEAWEPQSPSGYSDEHKINFFLNGIQGIENVKNDFFLKMIDLTT